MLPPSIAPPPPACAKWVSSRFHMLGSVWDHPSPHPAKTITLLVTFPLALVPSGSEPAMTPSPEPKPAEQSHGEDLAWGNRGDQKPSQDFFKWLSI